MFCKDHWNRIKWFAALAFLLVVASWDFAPAGENESELLPASRLMDNEIAGNSGDVIGEVDDLILKRNGKVKKLTLEVGGVLDIGDKLVAVPFNRIDRLEGGAVVLNVSEKDLESRPEFNHYQEGFAPEYYYKSLPHATPPTQIPPGGYYYYPPSQYPDAENYFRYPQYPAGTPYYPNPSAELFTWRFSPSRFLASVVLGRRIMNEKGEKIGYVDDLLINGKNEVEKIVIGSGGLLEERELVQVPYRPLGFTAYGLVYDIEPDEFGKLPRFSGAE